MRYKSLAMSQNQLQKVIKQPKIIACTGHSISKYKKKARESGMDDMLEKPLSLHKLQELLTVTGFIK